MPVLADDNGEEIDTVVFFRWAGELFINQLQSLAGQRLAQAEEEEKLSLEKALETLKDAESRLTDDVLTIDDKAELKPLLERVLKKQQDVQRRIKQYNKQK